MCCWNNVSKGVAGRWHFAGDLYYRYPELPFMIPSILGKSRLEILTVLIQWDKLLVQFFYLVSRYHYHMISKLANRVKQTRN